MRSVRGSISIRAGVVPGCSPSSSIGSGSSASTVTTRPRRSSRRGCGEVLAAVGLRQHEREVAFRYVADQEDVEEAVVGLGVGAHHHPASEVPPVADHRVDHSPAADLVVHRDAELARLPAEEHGEGRPVVGDLPAEGLRGLVCASGDGAGDPGARHVREPRRRLVPGPRPVGHDADVDRTRGAPERDVDRGVEVARNAVGAREVPARPARDDPELDALRAGDAVDDFVHRAVPADHDQPGGTVGHGLGGERRQPAGCVRDQRIALQPARGGAMSDLGPPPPRRAARGSGVDEEDSSPAANGRSGPRSPSRARSASFARRPRAAPRRRSGRTPPRRRCR